MSLDLPFGHNVDHKINSAENPDSQFVRTEPEFEHAYRHKQLFHRQKYEKP